MSELFIIATPIGNLADITYRAVETLRSVDIIAAEDTRHSLRLLQHYDIRKPLVSCHAHNEESSAGRIVAELGNGKTVGYISDAGTPCISDPGTRLVRAARAAGHRVVPIPGPSALTALASVAGSPGKRLVFEGFLSPKAGRRRKQLKTLLELGDNYIVYESPFRVLKLLGDLAELAPDRNIVIGRELTKTHEEIVDGTAAALLAIFGARQSIKGEFVLLVEGAHGSGIGFEGESDSDSDSDYG